MVEPAVAGRFTHALGAGAAGDVGFAALAVLGASAHAGIKLVMQLTGVAAAPGRTDVAITGEGSQDAQMLQGNGPAGVARAAAAAGIPILAVAGRVLLNADQLSGAGFDAAYALADIEPDPAVCLTQAGRLLGEPPRRTASAAGLRSCLRTRQSNQV